ncbi:MAG TPA: hypothetical protein VFP32_02770 [Candidatus Saccharimonadales bacterium]|nr:hypothetical protein [Candidatus Saccharimonadales bacterium]
MTDKNYTDVLLEDINGKFNAILEAVGGMQDHVKRIPDIDERVQNLENEMKTVRQATTKTNADLKAIATHIKEVNGQIEDIETRLSVVESV